MVRRSWQPGSLRVSSLAAWPPALRLTLPRCIFDLSLRVLFLLHPRFYALFLSAFHLGACGLFFPLRFLLSHCSPFGTSKCTFAHGIEELRLPPGPHEAGTGGTGAYTGGAGQMTPPGSPSPSLEAMMHGGPGGTPGSTGNPSPGGFSLGGSGHGHGHGYGASASSVSVAGDYGGGGGDKPTFRPHLCREWLDTASAMLVGSVCVPPAQKPDLLSLFRHSRSWCRGAAAGTCAAAHGVQEMQLPTASQFDAMVR